jgi:hypothetical protein
LLEQQVPEDVGSIPQVQQIILSSNWIFQLEISKQEQKILIRLAGKTSLIKRLNRIRHKTEFKFDLLRLTAKIHKDSWKNCTCRSKCKAISLQIVNSQMRMP